MPSVILRTCSSPREAWDGAIGPWFEQTLRTSWQQELPAVVVLPTRGQANALKARLLEGGQSHLGLHFLTPASLHEMLAGEVAPPSPGPEQLRLLLAIAAEKIAPEDPDELAAKSVVRAPGHLLRALQRLQTAGWKFDDLSLPALARIAGQFSDYLRACRFHLPGEIDRLLWKQAARNEPRFSSILVTGFDGAHWPQWFLLRAAVEAAKSATVLLEEPRPDLSEADLCWVGSWEEAYGEVLPAMANAALAVGDSLFTELEMRGAAPPAPRFDFLVGKNASEQADAIASQCARYLSEQTCTRLGIIFPGSGALPRLVASALKKLAILHNDGIAHIVPGIFESAEWQAWMELQRAPRLASFLRFLNSLRDPSSLSEGLSRPAFERTLRDSYREVLLDDLEVLREFCATNSGEKNQRVAETLRLFPFLPRRATLAQFLAQTRVALERLGWTQHWVEIANRSRDWAQRLDAEFSRALYLRWLAEAASTFGAARDAVGDHPYARVQLLTVPHAQGQEWSHLIFAGWNEGAWPPSAGAEFARDEEIRSFNQSVQQLNRRAARQGRQGDGHTSIRENHSLYLGPQEQRRIALRQFDALLEAASDGVTLAASLGPEDAPERLWNPSECFTRLYLQARRQPLTQAALTGLQRATAEWVRDSPALTEKPSPSDADVKQTLVAFQARRDPKAPAGDYDFALNPSFDYRPVPVLSVSDLEGMVATPALVWLKRYLGIEPADDSANPWAATSGKWVHRWLASIGGQLQESAFAPFPSPAEIDQRIRFSADEKYATLQRLCDSLGKSAPEWWRSGWLNARYLARHLGSKLSTAEGWSWMAAELGIGREGAVKIHENVEILLRGQIDLVLAQREPVAGDLAGHAVWIVDYKTGSTPQLKPTDLHDSLVKGTTLQLGLYSLAVRALGAGEVRASLLSPVVKTVAPQLGVDDLTPHTKVFADLAQMQQTGIFGMKGEIRKAYGFSADYPLATLQVDPDILEDKWALTHEALVLEKEEWETW